MPGAQGDHLWVASVGDSRAVLLTQRTQQGGWIPALHAQPRSSVYETEASLADVIEHDSQQGSPAGSQGSSRVAKTVRPALGPQDLPNAQPAQVQGCSEPWPEPGWRQQPEAQLPAAASPGLQLGLDVNALCSSHEGSEAAPCLADSGQPGPMQRAERG